jgi:hypothetical protein
MVLVATKIFSNPNSCVRPEKIYLHNYLFLGGHFIHTIDLSTVNCSSQNKKKRWRYLGLTCNIGNRVGMR